MLNHLVNELHSTDLQEYFRPAKHLVESVKRIKLKLLLVLIFFLLDQLAIAFTFVFNLLFILLW